MIIPVRCFSCGKVIGDKWKPYVERVSKGESPKDVLDDLGLKRYCCRRMIISHVEIIDKLLTLYQKRKEDPERFLLSSHRKRDDV